MASPVAGAADSRATAEHEEFEAIARSLASAASDEIIADLIAEHSALDPDDLKGKIWCVVHEALIQYASQLQAGSMNGSRRSDAENAAEKESPF